MPDRDSPASRDQRSAAERLIERALVSSDAAGRRFAQLSLLRERSLEAYLKAGGRPRWMQRVIDVDRGIAAERRRLADAHERVRAECGADAAAFRARWRAEVAAWPFDGPLNELIRQHNEWYPIERDLPMDPRTRDYVLVHGRSHRRPMLGPAWALEQFPA